MGRPLRVDLEPLAYVLAPNHYPLVLHPGAYRLSDSAAHFPG
jgi:hypothetical protein